MKAPLSERCRNRWLSILPLVGIGKQFLGRKHGPCPMCGGRDRYRFINKDGSGDWHCNQCGHGDGAELVKLFLKLDFKAAAEKIETILGATREDATPKRATRDEKAERRAMAELWERAWALHGSPGESYLKTTRRVVFDQFTIGQSLRFVPDCPYEDYPNGKTYPAIIAKVIGPNDRAINLHRTFITPDGRKADLDPVRKLMPGALPPGSAIRLYPIEDGTLGVAEGIETAMAATDLFKVPTWALLNAGGIERFVIPEQVKRLIIFADRDRTFTGERAAYILANRAVVQSHIQAEVRVPHTSEVEQEDWADFLLQYETEGVAA